MNRLALLLITAIGVSLVTGCSPAEIIVHAQQPAESAEGGEVVALKDLQVRLLPYDRDAIFDSLQAAHPVPQPEIPDTLLRLREAMTAAHNEWREAENRWASLRDSLANISKELEDLSPTSGQYRVLFNDFQVLEPEVDALRRRMDSAFNEFTSLQSIAGEESAKARVLRESWEDEAFADVDIVIYQRLKELGLKEQVETTQATGVATFKAKPGRWWVTARYDLPYEELYWNIPVEVQRGEPVEVKLTRENAQVRLKL